eukprot:scaffold262320_cov31-Tisochrysis_lutea.AAC.5
MEDLLGGGAVRPVCFSARWGNEGNEVAQSTDEQMALRACGARVAAGKFILERRAGVGRRRRGGEELPDTVGPVHILAALDVHAKGGLPGRGGDGERVPLRLGDGGAVEEEVLAGLELEAAAVGGPHGDVEHVAGRHMRGDHLDLLAAAKAADKLVDDEEYNGEEGVLPKGWDAPTLAAEFLDAGEHHEGHAKEDEVATDAGPIHEELRDECLAGASGRVPNEVDVVEGDVAGEGERNQKADELVKIEVVVDGEDAAHGGGAQPGT